MEVDLPKSTDYFEFSPEKLTLNFESIEKLLESAKFTVNIKLGDLVKNALDSNGEIDPNSD